MRVLLATIGTRGDVQPFLALALGLNAAGHDVTVATCPRFESFITDHGLRFLPLDEGLLTLLESQRGRELIGNLTGLIGVLRSLPKVLREVGPIHHRLVADAWSAVEASQPDVIVYHPKLFCMPAFAAVRDIPVVLALLNPMFVPTGEWPLPGLSRLPLGAAYNRATWRLMHGMMNLASRGYINAWRRRHDPLGKSAASTPSRVAPGRPLPVLHGLSSTVVPVAEDWPEHVHVTGYWFMPLAERATAPVWTPPEDLQRFLDAGLPPVYVGFGSMAGTKPEATTRLVLDAVQRAKVRAVIATGWGGMTAASLPSSVFMLDAAPHEWLFLRMAAVVHHGGAGTTAAGLRAGCPTVICPFGLDQPLWGRAVAALGAGPDPIPQKRLTVERLAAAIARAAGDAAMRSCAQRVGRAIQAENGVARAVAIIERIAARDSA
ncbi:MAG: glycosyltransferase family 1 protein [Betaproteobacteria bacterium]|nr:glycosyltransferase family 1 protein [Betaproteobacteria bacterium]